MSVQAIVKRQAYAGLFMVTLATLTYEILLTRIFSVTMYYHFAFIAISIAMFGMTVGAITVYLLPNYFTPGRAKYQIALSSLLFAVAIVLSFLIYLKIPYIGEVSIAGRFSLFLTYVVISVPFIFSGICVSLALSKFPGQVSKLYAADLAGAALGCILVIQILNITDGPTAVIAVAILACIGTIFFAVDGGFLKIRQFALISSLLTVSFVTANTVLPGKESPLLQIEWVKGEIEADNLYEKWNSFSRIRVYGNPDIPERIFSWGLSTVVPPDLKVRQLHMDIDATAGTVLTAFDGNLEDIEYLKYDVTNMAHWIRRDSKVVAVGPGGGRDILSALAFEQKSVLGIEINRAIIDAVNQRFGDFTGHLDRYPDVTFVNDEARSYITRLRDTFDIIQVSLIDSWAATAAGAFVLTENSLYTVEAWKVFLGHLNPNGILTFSRWYFRDSPGEMYRLTSLASASLTQLGVTNPRDHIVIVRQMVREGRDTPDGIGTILVSNEPFSDQDLDTIEQMTRELKFDLVLSPRFALDSTFASIASGKDLESFTARFPINISAPTDDSPFFFHMLRLPDTFNQELLDQGMMSFNMNAVYNLGVLLIIVVSLTFLCIIVPLLLTTKKTTLRGAVPLFIFFAAIGFGFMLVEIAQMQRLIIYLGHPTYGLSVVLFSLLLSSGLGSYSTKKIDYPDKKKHSVSFSGVNDGAEPRRLHPKSMRHLKNSAIVRLLFLLFVITITGKLTPYAIGLSQGAITMYRILIATAILFPMGLFMGMAFPLGMKIASTQSASITPWLWGINGATSVCASVLAVVIALNSGISTLFWVGFSCYSVAFIAFVWIRRSAG